MYKFKELLREPPVIIMIIATISISLIVLVVQSSFREDVKELEENNTILEIENDSYINNISDTINNLFISSTRTFFSQVYPEVLSIKIQENSLQINDDNVSFSVKTNDNKIFYYFFNDDYLTIKDSLENEIFSFPISDSSHYQLSPHLLDDYFPYKDYLSDGSYIEAKIQKDKKSIDILITSCVSEEIKKEAIEKTKAHISNLDSDPSFFHYTATTLCF